MHNGALSVIQKSHGDILACHSRKGQSKSYAKIPRVKPDIREISETHSRPGRRANAPAKRVSTAFGAFSLGWQAGRTARRRSGRGLRNRRRGHTENRGSPRHLGSRQGAWGRKAGFRGRTRALSPHPVAVCDNRGKAVPKSGRTVSHNATGVPATGQSIF